MIFVFDNSPMSTLFRNYYRSRFPSLWEKFDAIVEEGRLLSTREALNEINDGPIEALRDWATGHSEIFSTPTAKEGLFVAQILAVTHFQKISSKRNY